MKTILLSLCAVGLFAQTYQPNAEFVTSQPSIPTGSCTGQVSTLIRVTTSPYGVYQCGASGAWVPSYNAALVVANGKTLTVNKSLTLTGTDATTQTFPTTSATIARTDSAQTFTGVQTFTNIPIFTAGIGSATALSVVLPMTLTNLQSLHTVPFQILPPVAGTMYFMGPCALNLTYGSANFASGGTVTIGYDTTSSPATNGTIASTVFTTFSASQAVVVLPVAVGVTATTSLVNKGIYISAGSGDFTSGTGGSGQISCQYSALTGVS